jgi:selenocysteine lyase/cysteine desulfurase
MGPDHPLSAETGRDRIAGYERGLTAYAVERISAADWVRVLCDPVERISVVSSVI